MPTMLENDRQTIFLDANRVLTIVTGAGGAGRITRQGGLTMDGAVYWFDFGANSTTIIGPYAIISRHLLHCTSWSLSYSDAAAVYAEATSLASTTAALTSLSSHMVSPPADFVELFGAGAPALLFGANVAGIGSRYTDTQNGALYLNTGTKAVPVWTAL